MFNQFADFAGMGFPGAWFGGFFLLLPILILWSLFWKGLSLWHSARKAQPWWFVILLVLNTAGILDIIYLFAVLKLKPAKLFKK